MEDVKLEDVRELAGRVFGKPFALAVAGNPKLLDQIPSKEDIAEIIGIPENDKPVLGFLQTDKVPYDPRHGNNKISPDSFDIQGHEPFSVAI